MLPRRPRPKHPAESRSPFLAMWYQARAAIAELIIPLLAGLKTIWLLLATPLNFFRAYFFGARSIEQLHSPVDPLWRLLAAGARRPLDAAQFLLFGIFTAALAGFDFDNSNRLTGFLVQQGLIERTLEAIAARSPLAAALISSGQQALAHPLVVAVRSFFDQTLVAALLELVVTLLLTLLLAYLFYLLTGRAVSAAHSYPFWLYMTGLNYFTTGLLALVISVLSLAMLGLPPALPTFLFWLSETGFRIIWYYVYPAIVLSRLFPGLGRRQVVVASLAGRLILAGIGWLLTAGAVFALTLWGLMTG